MGKESQQVDQYFRFRCHALRIPKYISGKTDIFAYWYKWKDLTLSEARPMRLWQYWHFHLSDQFWILLSCGQDAPLGAPALASASVFVSRPACPSSKS